MNIGIPILGTLPLLTMTGTWYGYKYLLNRRLKNIGIYSKYDFE
jgi:hypothetical protein